MAIGPVRQLHRPSMSLRDLLVPSLDQGVAALLRDLSDRGLLDSTLVVVTTEFGRTPQINTMAGRDHWPAAFSIAMAGGRTDPTGIGNDTVYWSFPAIGLIVLVIAAATILRRKPLAAVG